VEHGYTGTLSCRLSRGRDLVAKFLYADVVTVIVVFVTIRLGWLAEQAKERERGLLGRLREWPYLTFTPHNSPCARTFGLEYRARLAGGGSEVGVGTTLAMPRGTTPSFTSQMQRIPEHLRNGGEEPEIEVVLL
jgi:hypothetical protein